MRYLSELGRWARVTVVATAAVIAIGGGYVLGDYTATQGTGTSFAAKVISGVQHAVSLTCDSASGEAQCQAVNGSGQAGVIEANSAAIATNTGSTAASNTTIATNTGNTATSAATTATNTGTTATNTGTTATNTGTTATNTGTTATNTATTVTNTGTTATNTGTTATNTGLIVTSNAAISTATGTVADALATNSTSSWSVVALLKGIYAQLVLILAAVQGPITAGSALIGKVGIDQTTPGTTNGVVDAPVNTNPTNISASTSATPSTATTLLAASATHRKIVIKVEGTSVVCFSQFGTAVIGAAGTWCLKGASAANAGDGGAYSTPGGMTEPNAISMVSASASVLVTGWWQ